MVDVRLPCQRRGGADQREAVEIGVVEIPVRFDVGDPHAVARAGELRPREIGIDAGGRGIQVALLRLVIARDRIAARQRNRLRNLDGIERVQFVDERIRLHSFRHAQDERGVQIRHRPACVALRLPAHIAQLFLRDAVLPLPFRAAGFQPLEQGRCRIQRRRVRADGREFPTAQTHRPIVAKLHVNALGFVLLHLHDGPRRLRDGGARLQRSLRETAAQMIAKIPQTSPTKKRFVVAPRAIDFRPGGPEEISRW